MPYRITARGRIAVHDPAHHENPNPDDFDHLTGWQKEVLVYLDQHYNFDESKFIPAHDIGADLKEHPRAISGIAYSLIKKGLVEKKEE